ncbi:MAG: hypothetical protein OXE52_14270 [Chloroflexi bacterium]|nr:hypothetical protein [Chloroflexota bacterium]
MREKEMRKYLLFIALFILMLLVIPTAAQQEEFTGNICYEKGDCGDGSTPESQWAWNCGWYAAARRAGVISGIPETCYGFGSEAISPTIGPTMTIRTSSESYYYNHKLENWQDCEEKACENTPHTRAWLQKRWDDGHTDIHCIQYPKWHAISQHQC